VDVALLQWVLFVLVLAMSAVIWHDRFYERREANRTTQCQVGSREPRH
jgi:hypothetical protein